MNFDVFISYAHQDKTTADAACAILEGDGTRCWIAPRDILPGADWSESIIDAIAKARIMILVFSGHANASPQIKREVERAVNKGIPIIPMRIEDISPSKALEYFISTPHWLDAFTPPLEQHLRHLSQSIKTLLALPGAGVDSEHRAFLEATSSLKDIQAEKALDRAYQIFIQSLPWLLILQGLFLIVCSVSATLSAPLFRYHGDELSVYYGIRILILLQVAAIILAIIMFRGYRRVLRNPLGLVSGFSFSISGFFLGVQISFWSFSFPILLNVSLATESIVAVATLCWLNSKRFQSR